jgi:lipopolysaccharide/colanic/teichoic acid biosynthesis glycosyltransferase
MSRAVKLRTKRAIDVAAIVLLSPILAPIAFGCWLAVRLDSPGRAVFRQQRTGLFGRKFQMYKFRTMVHDAAELKQSLQHLNVLPAPDFKIPDDPRITRVGKMLRATSLDELPQLWNVLIGDMSLVGPRPTSFSPENPDYQLWHTRRLDVRPGLTGLWQIEGRTTTTFDERIRLDEAYIRNWSLGLDVRIILRTLPVLLRKEGT